MTEIAAIIIGAITWLRGYPLERVALVTFVSYVALRLSFWIAGAILRARARYIELLDTRAPRPRPHDDA
jgi:hypothetical protein